MNNFFQFSVFLIFLLLAGRNSCSQPVLYLDFKDGLVKQNEKIISPEMARYKSDLQLSEFVPGLKDLALDLSENAVLRKPWVLDSTVLPECNEKSSFSVQIWVKTLPYAKQGTPVIGNKKADSEKDKGWLIYTQENSAWALNLSDGKNQFNYIPTVERQAINDGHWHQLVFSINRDIQEARIYFDGRNVAIYNIQGLRGMETNLRTIAGGSDEYWEWGSYGQWNSFNGYIDEVKIWDKAISDEDIIHLYEEFFPYPEDKKSEHIFGQLKVLSWNIWHGGHRFGKSVGLQRVIDIIKSSNADIVTLIETYGSGEIIADSLGYYFYLISSNLSIMSRFPIAETHRVFRAFNCGGATVDTGSGEKIRVYCTWLHYLPDVRKNIVDNAMLPEELVRGEGNTRHSEIKQILEEIKPALMNSDEVPVIVCGDFNSGSHLDWTETTKSVHYGYVVRWPVTVEMEKAGFIDCYREIKPNPMSDPGYTSNPRFTTSTATFFNRNRIDYIFYQSKRLEAMEAITLEYHPVRFPSDHAAVIGVFRYKQE